MQLLFILAILFALGAVGFAFQNDATVTLALGYWHFDASLAVIVLISMGIGALIAGLLASPKMIAGQVESTRLRWRLGQLEQTNARQEQHIDALKRDLKQRGESRSTVTPAVVTPAVVSPPAATDTVVRTERVETRRRPNALMRFFHHGA
jgi:uncharacterized integral membrane protein